ncbi:MAG: hypothetical protein GTN81_03150 [Proteobacteria bacterium]|nr:hypothetical protein [Pseudomonadota bacterium]
MNTRTPTKWGRAYFLERLERVTGETGTRCSAWALIRNHFHLPRKTRHIPIVNVEPSEMVLPGKERKRVQGSSISCYWAARESGVSMAELPRGLRLSPALEQK